MKDRLFRIRRLLSGAIALLLIGGLMYSCSDDYDLPDKTPSWLGSSIYNYLKEQGNYTNTVKLIDDLNYAEVLGRTGSKTIFVADDDAYARFFKNNPWGVQSYKDLSQSQKKLLLNSTMFDNAYLLEMMPHLSSGSLNSEGSYLSKNQCLRQYTSVAITDSITFFNWDDPAIPQTYNLGLKNSGQIPDKDNWTRFREQSKGGIRMATDATVPLMVHWIAGQMGEQKITNDDFAKIVGKSRDANDVYIFGSKVIKQDITCQNGYIDVLDEVFTTPTNMAEMIRTNGHTNYFSHMLDRFSAPYYNSALTTAYRQLNPAVDSVFEKRYLSARSKGGSALERIPGPNGTQGNKVSYYLSYDPGWNQYYNASHGIQVDMGAMFAPSDAAIEKYFLNGGGGAFLMEAYAVQKPVTKENLMYNLDQIPLDVIQALINNLMKTSFIESVPSKYLTIMNDARDPMFSNAQTVEDYKAKIDTCLIANNGVVYIMNEVYTPAKYASVSAPALVGDSLRIFNWAVTADDKYITNPTSAPLNAFISTYLLAMSTNFSFFVPSDNALQYYVQPASMGKVQPYVLTFKFDSRNQTTPVTARARKYDKLTGEIDTTYMTKSVSKNEVNYALKDMLDAHIIVDSTASKLGVYDGNQYFVSKGGAPIKVTNPNAGKNGMQVQGGWQIDKDQFCNVTEVYDKSERTNGYGNGMTYVIDRPIESTVKSVSSVLADNEDEESPYRMFRELCLTDADVIDSCGLLDACTNKTDKAKELQKYMIFTTNNPCLDENVRFFNTYRYTVYVPTNESVEQAIANGLPTWESIKNYLRESYTYLQENETAPGFDVEAYTANFKAKAQAMVTCLLNFVKYHFQDNSIFIDNNAIQSTAYETACINNVTNRYITVNIESASGHSLSITDQNGSTRNVITADPQTDFNILTRDMEFDKSGESASYIATSSFAVIHRIDGVLNFMKLPASGRYDESWTSTGGANKFIAKYRIRK